MTAEVILYIMNALLLVIVWFSKKTLNSIEKKQDDTLAEVKATNGRVTRLEIGLTEHNRLDDVRFHDLEKRLDRELD